MIYSVKIYLVQHNIYFTANNSLLQEEVYGITP